MKNSSGSSLDDDVKHSERALRGRSTTSGKRMRRPRTIRTPKDNNRRQLNGVLIVEGNEEERQDTTDSILNQDQRLPTITRISPVPLKDSIKFDNSSIRLPSPPKLNQSGN